MELEWKKNIFRHRPTADVAFLNLETASCGDDKAGTSKCSSGSTSCYSFRMPVRFLDELSDAGIDMVSLANNHALDYGMYHREREKIIDKTFQFENLISNSVHFEKLMIS
jgi:hypothetical protein